MKSWISEAVIYQVNLRAIAFREPRNPFEALDEPETLSSPLDYLRRHLPQLGALGPTVLHLQPPFLMGRAGRKGIGSPYAIRDFYEIDSEYGTLEEFKALLRDAHQLGYHVILGMVPNHTSRDHEWMDAYPQFYLRDAGGAPLHDADWTDTAKLDYNHPGLREAMLRVFDHWLGLLGAGEDGVAEGVDGFRVDMAHFINDPGFWDELAAKLAKRFPGREILMLAEAYGDQPARDLLGRGFNAVYDDTFYKVAQSYYGRDAVGQSCICPAPDAGLHPGGEEVHRAFETGGIAGAMEWVIERQAANLPAREFGPWWVRYTDNHDEGRGVYRFGDGAVLALNQLLFLSGPVLPFLLAGQEFGAENRPSIHTRLGLCEKGFRTPDAGGPRFTPGIEFEGNLFARGRRVRRGWFAFYRDLIALRLETPELTRGGLRILEPGEDCPENRRTVVAFERSLGDGLIRCAVNLGPETRRLRHAGLFRRKPLYGALVDKALHPFTSVVVRAR